MENCEQMDKPLRDLIEIIRFTEDVSAKIHGLLDEAEIYRTVIEAFAQSRRYTASILLLTEDGSSLRIVETSLPPEQAKEGEKKAGVRLKGYKIDLDKSSIYRQVVREGKTLQVKVSDVIGELFPRPLAYLISKAMGYEKKPAILTPLKRHGRIIGALAMTAPELAEPFIPSVRNLARHISAALELTREHAERVRTQEALQESEEKLRAQYKGIPIPTGTWQRVEEDFVLVDYNDALEEITRGGIADFVGMKARDLYRDRPDIVEGLTRCFAEKTAIEEEMSYRYKSTGESRHLAVKYAFVPPDLVLVHTEDITKRVRAEEALRESEAKYRNLTESLDELVYRADPDTFSATFVNSAVERIYGYTLEEWLTDPTLWERTVHPDDQERVFTEFTEARKTLKPRVVQYRIVRKDQEVRWVDDHVSWEMDDQDQVVSMNGVMYDITGRKRVEEALERRVNELKALSAMATIVNQSLEVDEILERAMDEALRQVGVEAAAVMLLDDPSTDSGQRSGQAEAGELALVAHRGLSDEFVRTFRRMKLGEGLAGKVAETGEPSVLHDLTEYPEALRSYVEAEKIRSAASVPLMGRTGVIGTMNLGTASPEYFDPEGVDLLVGLGRQIAVGLEKAWLYQKARESQEKLRAQYKGIPVPTYTWQRVGEDLVLVDYNDAAKEISQGRIASFVGIKANEMYRDMPEIREELWRCCAEKTTISREMPYQLKSTGESKHLAVKYAFVPPDLVLVHTEDITERREMQERLVRQEKLAVLGKLAGGVGHELRNPLGAIKNAAYFLQMALAERELDPEVRETLEILEREVTRSERIVGDLLDFARARPPTRRRVDLNELVQAVLSRAEIPQSIEVMSRLDEDLPSILADPDQLDQVFGNLIRNAVQAMPDGGRLVVQTEMEDPEWLTVSIADTGVGIPEENREKIFEPLFTTRAKGIGLGLAIVKTLVEAHGGAVEVESEVGEGSTFTVRLPVGGEKGG